MKEIVYSPEYLRRILELRDYLYEKYGDRNADRRIKEITETV
jgi:plasmid stabilization system protein ParE